MADDIVVVPEESVRQFVVRVMTAVGAIPDHAQLLAEVLTTADMRGHYSHGLNRLDMYTGELRKGVTIKSDETPQILKETCATALVDGKSLLGPVVGRFCIDLAIEKAKVAGIGWVSAKGANHFGIAGWYSMRAMKKGYLGMAFTNTSPSLVPTRAKTGTLGTNPITLAAPGLNGDEFVLDMATTSVARGKIEIQKMKKEPMPTGWAVDKDGHETLDPDQFSGLQPLGGTEESSGYKGFGLAMMVEIFCGMLSGSTYGPNVRGFKQHINPANLGQCFVAINPSCFADGFEERLTDLMNHLRSLDPVNPEERVLVPGDPEREHIQRVKDLGGIPYHKRQIKTVNEIAAGVGVGDLVSV